MQVRGKTRWCFSVILAFSKSLHESCRLFAFYRRAAHFFFLQAVYLGLTLWLHRTVFLYLVIRAWRDELNWSVLLGIYSTLPVTLAPCYLIRVDPGRNFKPS